MKTHSIAVSTCGAPPETLDFKAMADAGVDAVEISPSRDRFYDYPYLETKRAAEKAGVVLWSFHLPFFDPEKHCIANVDEAARREAVRRHSLLLEIAALAGIRRAVIHPSWEPNPENGPEREALMDAAKTSLAQLAEKCGRLGVVLCVEDLPRTCLGNRSSEILELLSADPRLRCCFDTNHLLSEPPEDFIRAVGPKIETVHVSDFDFINERHWLPGEGGLDWTELMNGLDAAGYSGPLLFEVNPHASDKSIARPRDLVYGDYVRCARELMARAPLTVLAKGKENLPLWP